MKLPDVLWRGRRCQLVANPATAAVYRVLRADICLERELPCTLDYRNNRHTGAVRVSSILRVALRNVLKCLYGLCPSILSCEQTNCVGLAPDSVHEKVLLPSGYHSVAGTIKIGMNVFSIECFIARQNGQVKNGHCNIFTQT